MIFMIVKMFGVVVAVSGTPYTMEQCSDSLRVLKNVPELQTEFYCTCERPELGQLTPEQVEQVNQYMSETN